jgi:hypothetical protein
MVMGTKVVFGSKCMDVIASHAMTGGIRIVPLQRTGAFVKVWNEAKKIPVPTFEVTRQKFLNITVASPPFSCVN